MSPSSARGDDGIAGTARSHPLAGTAPRRTLLLVTTTIVVLRGDQTGQELLDESLRVIGPGVTGLDLELQMFELSLAHRRATKNGVVADAADAMRAAGFGLKAATVTPVDRDDVGSPNALLRERVGGRVILRTGQRIPGVAGIAGVSAPISIVRMAIDDAYNAREWREATGSDEIAYRTEHISRSTCRAVAEFAFVHAERTGARVFGGPKFTVSRIYEGMFKEEMDAAAARHPDVDYEPQLIDATYALLFSRAGDPLVIPALNRDGDCLSDLVLPLFGSIAGAESLLLGFDDDALLPTVVMAEAPHGTAPALEGKNVANPMAMILAAAALLGFAPDPRCRAASTAIRDSVFEVLRAGVATADLGGNASTSDFTDSVIARVRAAMSALPPAAPA
jgi:isocitrate dehydrogenase (NAD+)